MTAHVAQPHPDQIDASPQDGVGRAFAAITLLAGTLLAVGPFAPWGYVYSTYGVAVPINAIGTLDGGAPRDGVIALAVGLAALCVGALRMATRVPLALRLAQMVVGALIVIMALHDVSKMRYPGPGAYTVMFGAAMLIVGAEERFRKRG